MTVGELIGQLEQYSSAMEVEIHVCGGDCMSSATPVVQEHVGHVLLIGDSISMGYTLPVRAALGSRTTVDS